MTRSDARGAAELDEQIWPHAPYVRWTATCESRAVSLAELAERGVAWAVARMCARTRLHGRTADASALVDANRKRAADHCGVASEVARSHDVRATLAPVFDFVDALAALYADLWFSGSLDQVRQESNDDDE